ncbi:formate dehydrogenase subunit beta [Enterobacter asburiae]|uniref:Formate dehydrogenase subunit beta n=1 Tax=Enterobacter asburiae TaxID=61645 RepID=A0A376FHF3_ENTAS|nr:formate dehydrogenase subunit beta [Enterobacter asburiae]
MYVLHHADKPNLYHGLPENPEISATVKFWKGIWKPLAAGRFCCHLRQRASSTTSALVRTAREEEDDNLHEEKDEVRK